MFDLGAGSLLFLANVPLMTALACLIKLTSRGPVLYVAPRVGKGGRHFPFYKFRSMVADAETRRDALAHKGKDGHIFKIRNDPRLTPVGRFMRRFSLDELPQLLNVLKGDMSLVGPRPLPACDLEADGMSREHAFWAHERSRILPGITGLWQIEGRSDLGFEEMIRLDVAYARTWSILRRPEDPAGDGARRAARARGVLIMAGLPVRPDSMRAGAFGVADQCLLSLANLAVGLAAARALAPADFGVYVIAFAVGLAGGSVQQALITDPLVILGATRQAGAQSGYVAALLRVQLMCSLLIVLAVALVAGALFLLWGAASSIPAALLAVAAALLPVQLQMFLRATFFARLKPSLVLTNDIIFVGLRLGIVAALMAAGRLTIIGTLLAAGAAAAVAFAAGLPASRQQILARPDPIAATWAAQWSYGRWLLATARRLLVLGAGALVDGGWAAVAGGRRHHEGLPVAGVASSSTLQRPGRGAGAARVAACRRVRPAALARFLRFSRLRRRRRHPLRRSPHPSQSRLMDFIYNGRYAGYSAIVGVLLADALLSAISKAPVLGLKVIGDTRSIFHAYLCSAVAGLSAMLLLAPTMGVFGAALAAPASSLALVLVLLLKPSRGKQPAVSVAVPAP